MDIEQLKAQAQGRPVAANLIPRPTAAPAAAPAELIEFLQGVLPADGVFMLAEIGPHGAAHAAHDDVRTLAEALAQRSAAGRNVYFAMGAFAPQRGRVHRRAELVQRLRSLWLDIDVGKGGKSYNTAAEADAAIAEFAAALGLAPTFLMASGAGRHVYFAMHRDMPTAEWHTLAMALKQYSGAWGLKADAACTADAARVLRAPCTRTKHGNVAAILSRGAVHKVEALKEALERLRCATNAKPVRKLEMAAEENSVLTAGLRAPRVDWLDGLDADAQLGVLDEMMNAVPVAGHWDAEPWWSQVVRAVAALDELPVDARLDLLVKHSARAPAWAADGWTRERLVREKWRTANGTASLSNLVAAAEAAGWIRPAGMQSKRPFVDRAALEKFLGETFIFVAEMAAYLNKKTRALLSPEAVAEAHGWRTPFDPEKPIRLRTVLRTSRAVERVDRMAYAPGEAEVFTRGGARVANTWTPWNPSPLDPTDAERQVWNEFLDHLLPLGDEDAASFRAWILRAFAWLAADGSHRLPVAVLLVGAQGCGKSTLLEEVPRRLFGPANVATVSAGEIESDFTDWLGGSRIVTMPELRMGSARDARRVADHLKALVTSEEVRIHPKGAKGYMQRNAASFFASSNHADALHLEDDDRRWAVCESPAGRLPDELAEKLYTLLHSDRAPGVLSKIFSTIDIAGFRPHQLPRMSVAKEQMIEASRMPVEAALAERFDARDFPFDRPVFVLEDCKAALIEDDFSQRMPSMQVLAAAVRGGVIRAQEVARVRCTPRRAPGAARSVHAPSRLRVYVARRDGPDAWKAAGEEALREALSSTPAAGPMLVR